MFFSFHLFTQFSFIAGFIQGLSSDLRLKSESLLKIIHRKPEPPNDNGFMITWHRRLIIFILFSLNHSFWGEMKKIASRKSLLVWQRHEKALLNLLLNITSFIWLNENEYRSLRHAYNRLNDRDLARRIFHKWNSTLLSFVLNIYLKRVVK